MGKRKKHIKHIRYVKNQMVDRTTGFVTAAFGLAAALAWNNTIQTIFKQIFGEASNIPAMLFYSVTVTVIAIIIIIWIGKLAERAKTPIDDVE